MKHKKIRMTRQRGVILEELRAVKTHPTADEMYEKVKKRIPRISLATVYRNLEVLCGLGVIQKLDITGRQKRFDADTSNHYHIKCIKCGKVDDLYSARPDAIEKAVEDHRGYEVLGHRLEFEGICPKCREAGGKEPDTQ
ncbi:MAG: transcriptional repressor [Desulfobacteraceae bacterium]|nr:transcriptional repressor [Desulfobacteraceae bacterium]